MAPITDMASARRNGAPQVRRRRRAAPPPWRKTPSGGRLGGATIGQRDSWPTAEGETYSSARGDRRHEGRSRYRRRAAAAPRATRCTPCALGRQPDWRAAANHSGQAPTARDVAAKTGRRMGGEKSGPQDRRSTPNGASPGYIARHGRPAACRPRAHMDLSRNPGRPPGRGTTSRQVEARAGEAEARRATAATRAPARAEEHGAKRRKRSGAIAGGKRKKRGESAAQQARR